MTTIRIFVIDDHFLIGSGFRDEFTADEDGIELAGYALDPLKALEMIGSLKVDVIVLDLFIKFLDPVANIRLIRNRYPQTPIIILSQEDSIEWQCLMFSEGASAYLHKSESRETIRDVIRQVEAGKLVIPEKVARFNIKNISNIQELVLQPEEKTVISELSVGHSIKEIAVIHRKTPSSIEKMLKRMRERFRARTTYELLMFLAKQGHG